jgi:4-hydroxy-tetrahydrodipicolinate synthase
MKDSSGDWSNTQAFLDAFASSGFDVFAGSETFLLRNMRRGGAGCISATANVNPGAIAHLFDSWQAADADAQQSRLDEIRGVFQKFPMIPALKAAIAHYGQDQPWATVRPPLAALSEEQARALIMELDQKGFTMPGLAGR